MNKFSEDYDVMADCQSFRLKHGDLLSLSAERERFTLKF